MKVFVAFLVVCFVGSLVLRGRSLAWRAALVMLAALLACFAYYVLHAL